MERSLAVDVAYVGLGDPGDGVPASVCKQFPIIHTASVVFNFNEATIKEFKAMGIDNPWAVLSRKGEADSIEFAIPSPTAEEMQFFCGGTIDAEGKWSEPISLVTKRKTLKLCTRPYQGKYTEYVIVNGNVAGRLSQAPSEEDTDLLLVKVTKQAVFDSNGKQHTAFTRHVRPIETTKVESVTIKGTPKVGIQLTAETNPAEATGTYQWFRKKDEEAKPIPNVDSAGYTPTSEDIGYTISVKFTGTDSYSDEVESSETTAVVA